MPLEYEIIEFDEKYRKDLIDLWKICDLTRPWNDPDRDIDRKLTDHTGKLFLLKKMISSWDPSWWGTMVTEGPFTICQFIPTFRKKTWVEC